MNRKISFKKTTGKFDDVEYFEDGLVISKITNPKQRIIPHDLIHALIESHFGVMGFTDLVFKGVKPGADMGATQEAWLSEAMVESVQGMLWSGQLNFEQFNNWISSICEQRKVPATEVSKELFTAFEKLISEYSQKWEATLPGSRLEFIWKR